VAQLGDGRLRGRDDVEAPAGVEVGARRVEDPRRDDRDFVALPRDLRDDDVGVVAVGRGDERVRVGDAGLLENRCVHAVAEVELAGPVRA
jgi:hypothetical protein